MGIENVVSSPDTQIPYISSLTCSLIWLYYLLPRVTVVFIEMVHFFFIPVDKTVPAYYHWIFWFHEAHNNMMSQFVYLIFFLKPVFSFHQSNTFIGFKDSNSSKSHIMKKSSQLLVSDFSLQRKSISTLLIILCGIYLYIYKYTCTVSFSFQLFFFQNIQSFRSIGRMIPSTKIHQVLTFCYICFIPLSLFWLNYLDINYT